MEPAPPDFEIPETYRAWLRLGTCSWKDDSWRGIVYRPGIQYQQHDFLPDYAKHLNSVEIDQWFWSLFPAGVRLPDPETARIYAESVPDDFVFSVKAPNSITLTHFYSRQPKRYAGHANKPNPDFLNPDLLERFLEAVRPLRAKLGPVMFQFEYLNRTKMPSRKAFLDRLHEFFLRAPSGYTYAIETRNPKYLSKPLFDFLREHRLGFVFLEGYYMPHVGEVFRKFDTFTPACSVIRLHGPDRQAMELFTRKVWDRIVIPRPKSIQAAVDILRRNRDRGCVTYVNANNHLEGCAPLTASRFLAALRQRTP
jgi:uncharacterized protein YecE (DUF72 family)